MIFEKATLEDLNLIVGLYDAVCDRLAETVNYPGWAKSIYPTREVALKAVKDSAHIYWMNP